MTDTAIPTYPFTLPPLRFAYHALEPYMDARTLEIHHLKYHADCITALNESLSDQPQLHKLSIEELLRHLDHVPEAIREDVAFYGGGHANHQFFWKILKSGGKTEPKNKLKVAIEQAFDSIESFKTQFMQAALSLRGSGWVFLVIDPQRDGTLALHRAKNHESVLPLGTPGLLICDVWEHAYYLPYQNHRVDYLEAYWHLVDWNVVEARLEGIRAGHKQL